MSRKLLFIALAMTFTFAASAMAQDDPFGLTGYADGNMPPLVLDNNTEYTFAFDVFNQSGGDVAIQIVEITLPSDGYTLDEGDLEAPEALHPSEHEWDVDYDDDNYTIKWESSGAGHNSTADLGDIREGEMLQFSFVATTDSNKAATDGFAWTLTGDDNGETESSGFFEFGEAAPDDDDDSSGDDDDNDDNDSGGCGC